MSFRYRSSVLGCQSVVAPAYVVSRPGGVSRVWGGSACGPSTLWRSEVVVLAVRHRSHLVVLWSWQVAVVAVSRAWRVWSLGVFVPWQRGWRWTPWQWSSLCGGRLQASPSAVLLVVFGAFECACAAKAERACVCVAFTGAGLLLVELVEGVPALLAAPLLLGVRGGSACGPSTLWRSEVAVLAMRRRSHLVVLWSRQFLLLWLVRDW
ncbi:hypothetical protein Taro_028526 [Colocasia esculenta]|uniref:Uncharacterized protein n=1 Tax=Colocasia esculenta TaxID=4460 RepID=A0A843VNE1_COLES|nr:hypothetical protein [Colocasia esculenta]